jgi:hypothetical protein
VVDGFGEISPDNRRIIAMEWVVEGVALIFIGALIICVTAIDPSSDVSRAVYLLAMSGLLALAAVSLFTGFQVEFPPFKLCPVIFTYSAILVLVGGVIMQ